ncbi:efflux RND transporter periplasmic adaptor subunit [Aestuariicella sp. G3-2]|uniref:efflux RND transporter periplasmic adaptor subunit n=1 Tax=Pseudomaricurvus albidus TaxID=2842452 RepID=UPI001C0DADB4|nr:efflux RND transporter periplasmic adaptor subunit [Aestuariicella albida]MBU3070201.1 efflux RND transporter periplasmic adaptor subunit [Aestuariicella albida]
MTQNALAQQPTPVTITLPKAAIPTYQLSLAGDLVSAQHANLSPRIEGLVSQVNVDVGDRVTAGDVLLTLDPTLAEHVLQQYAAATAAARATYQEDIRLVEEAERLTKQNHLPQNELTLRRAALAISRAHLDAAKAEQQAQAARLAWHQLKAPFDGVISRKLTESGEWITPGTSAFELVSTDKVYLDVQVPQERFAQLKPNTPVNVRPDTQTGTQTEGRIAAIVPVSNSGSRTIQVRLVMENPQQKLLPGTSATAIFEFSPSDKKSLLIPRDALLRSPDGSFSAFVVSEQGDQLLAERRKLQLGLQSNGSVEILDGLKANDKVVVRGNEILRHNQPVSIQSTTESVQLHTAP